MCLSHKIYHLKQAESGGSGIVSRRLTGPSGSEQFVMKIPNNKVLRNICFGITKYCLSILGM